MTGLGQRLDFATIPPLRGPTRPRAARKRKSGRSGRDDSFRWDTTTPHSSESGRGEDE